MKPDTIRVWLLAGLAFTRCLSYFMVDRGDDNWMIVFLGVWGSWASVLGIIYTLYQVYQVKSEALLIKSATEAVKARISDVEHFGGLARAVELIRGAQGFLRLGRYEVVIMRLQDVMSSVVEVGVAAAVGKERDYDRHLRQVNFHISSLEKQLAAGGRLDTGPINADMEGLADFLIALKTDIMGRN